MIRRPAGIGRLSPRLIVVGDLLQPLGRCILHQGLEHDGRARKVVEQPLEQIVEQRHPVLHAGMAASLAHRFVQEIVAPRGAETG